MIMQAPMMGNKILDEEHFEIWLGPYIGTRAITTEQATQTIASGVSLEECHDRLLDAECLLMTTHNPMAWQRGWMDAVDAITWLATPENTSDLGLSDLLELAEDRYQKLRRECYATALTTGTPALDEIAFSNTIGRVDCCTAGMWFVVDMGKTISLPVVPMRAGNSLEKRVESYLQSVPQAAEGQRNQAAFNLAGHLRSFEHDGEILTEDSILFYCRHWNANNAIPLSDDELQKAIDSSGRNGTPREIKPNRTLEAFRSAVDLTAIRVPELNNDWREIASVLKSTTDRRELRQKAERIREEDYLNSRNRIPELLQVLGSLQTIGGAK